MRRKRPEGNGNQSALNAALGMEIADFVVHVRH
jgi:hypothetical protein